jgi:hypothetical protein
MGGSGHGLILGTIRHLPGGTEEKLKIKPQLA